jgi:ATP-dependent RNA helicase DeaD
MSHSDIVKHFVSLEFNELLDYYKNARDLNIKAELPRDPFSRNDRGSERGGERLKFTKLFINAGKKQNLNASGLIGMINEFSGRRNIEIGKIDIQRKFSFFEIDSNYERDLVKSLNNAVIEGHVINIGRVESTAGQDASTENRSFRSEGRGGSGFSGGYREGRREGGFNDRGDRPRRRRN